VTSIADQYRIITASAGWIDRSFRGRLRFDGPDAIPFLQDLLTNDVGGLQAGQGAYAAYLTPLGRMTADVVVLHRGGYLLGLVGEGMGATLATRFDQLIFAENLTVSDATMALAELFVTGTAAASVVGAAVGIDSARLDSLAELEHVDCSGGFVMRDGASTLPAFRIVVDAGLRGQVVEALAQAGVVSIGEELVTALRIEAGRGEWGHELGGDVIPLEAGLLDRAISTSKGCYVGQEIVIRILHRGGGRVAKRLVTLAFDAAVNEAPVAGAPIDAGTSSAAGHLTSVAFSPVRGCFVGLAYLHRDAAEVGRQVAVGVSGSPATVTGFAT
jgi:folate-binding protein YgfZ